ncbi:T3SS effector HopA1 family protein [Streptomyces boninensis]|uniref:T3SS effector HopA1 family protein n=1 Tax=Streptomyces boninensis TaxID=2039455 RepID=UPI003B221CFF
MSNGLSTRKKKRNGSVAGKSTGTAAPAKTVRFGGVEVIPDAPVRTTAPVKPKETQEPLNLTFDLGDGEPLAKTKRDDLVDIELDDLSETGLTDAQRHEMNQDANEAFLRDVYYEYYTNPKFWKMSAENRSNALYNFMGAGQAGYLKDAVPKSVIDTLLVRNDDYSTRSQKYSDYLKAKNRGRSTAGLPSDQYQAATRGDYFHIFNRHYVSTARDGLARRIVVNVTSQQAGWKLTQALLNLYKEGDTRTHLREFKTYLSTTANKDRKVKFDKLVIYYNTGVLGEDGSDLVGDRIVTAITDATDPADIDASGFAPFYSHIAQGIAWAEEPEHHTGGALKGSFTTTRRDIIAAAMDAQRDAEGPDAFISMIGEAFERASVQPKHPHRHIPRQVAEVV